VGALGTWLYAAVPPEYADDRELIAIPFALAYMVVGSLLFNNLQGAVERFRHWVGSYAFGLGVILFLASRLFAFIIAAHGIVSK
jgi:hypothetical protein